MDRRMLIYVLLISLSFFFIHKWFSTKTKEQQPPSQKQEYIPAESLTIDEKREEKFYVLENQYFQLVFSSLGGALAEINLPFYLGENHKSIIHPIEFDRKIARTSPQNELFPLNGYYYYATDEKKIVYQEKGKEGGYYPLLRRSIQGINPLHISPNYYALNLISADSDLSQQAYQVTQFDSNAIQFEITFLNRKITKRFSLDKDAPYCLNVQIRIEGDKKNLWITSGIPEVELSSGAFLPTLKYRIMRGPKSVIEKISLPKATITVSSIQPDWICNSNGYFGIIIDPIETQQAGYRAQYIPGQAVPTRLSLIDPAYHLYPPEKYPGYLLSLPMPSQQEFRIFAGPLQNTILKKVNEIYSNPMTGYSPDYTRAQSFQGWFAFISEPFAKFLFLLMQLFFRLTHSWGFSIILLTVALRVMLYPLNSWSIRSTLTSNQKLQELAPKVKAAQARYKKDPKRMQIETMKIYREAGINPLSGCFPLLIQMPFLIGMFDLLKSTFELRGAVFIPGWIDNLTAPDVLFSWNYPIFFFGTEFHFLPIVLGAITFFQQRFSSKIPKDRSQWTDQHRQMYMMSLIMPLFLTFIFYKMPSGLNIYFLSSTLLGIVQQWWLTKKKPKIIMQKKR